MKKILLPAAAAAALALLLRAVGGSVLQGTWQPPAAHMGLGELLSGLFACTMFFVLGLSRRCSKKIKGCSVALGIPNTLLLLAATATGKPLLVYGFYVLLILSAVYLFCLWLRTRERSAD